MCIVQCRHAWSVTSSRPGLDKSPYLYTLTLSCPDEKWPTIGPIYEACQKSFRLTPTTKVTAQNLLPTLIFLYHTHRVVMDYVLP